MKEPKILILRLSSIGDIVLTSPVPRCLRKAYPNARIHYATKKGNRSILEHNPYIDRIHLLDQSVSELIAELRKEEFDYIIDLHHNLVTKRIKRALKATSSSFHKLNIEKFLLVAFKIPLQEHHIVPRYLATGSFLGIKDDGEGLDYYIAPAERVNPDSLPEAFRNGYIGISVGAQHATKCLPKTKMIELCSLIDAPIILMGGPEDSDLAEEVILSLPEKPIFNACGKYSLNQSASLVEQSKLMIAHDTGLMHIAAAFGKNILSVWGNTVPELGMTPYKAGSESRIFEIKQLKCRPCSKIGSASCPKKHFGCMQQQNCHAIAALANELFRR